MVSDADFNFDGLLPGEYFLRTRVPWIVKSISWNGRIYTDVPFGTGATPDIQDVEVVVTQDGATLSGTITTGQNTQARDAIVLLFPATAALWTKLGLWSPRIRSVTASPGGQYEITNVPAGDYLVIAVGGPSSRLRIGPEFFRAVEPFSTRVSLAWSQAAKIDLVVRDQSR